MIGAFLRQITTALEMHGVPYMLTGSLASSMYGIPRATNDIDIVIAPTRDQLLNVVQMFQRVGLTVHPESALNAYRNRTQFNVIDFPKSFKVDLILRQDREFSVREFERRETHEVDGMRLTLATPEDVLIAKLEWAKMGDSERQLQDAAGIIKMQHTTLDFRYVEEWVETLQLHSQWAAVRELAG
ncbi:MAG TPA: nucleotidyltransferase [Thermoanaerobaculia bacterium]|nr:nucleotidyltransferase [Thermoanaerobaculia bacterium]